MSGRAYRPSSIARVIACPPSAVLPGDDTASQWANEGTAAHTLIEMCYRLELSPADFCGQLIDVYDDDGVTVEQFKVTVEMVEAVDVFIARSAEVEKFYSRIDYEIPKKENGNRPASFDALTEVKLKSVLLSSLDFSGTIDRLFVSYEPKRKTAHILDYKHGAGVKVDTEDNAQLISYALLVFENFETVKTVAVEIIQPRIASNDNDSNFVSVTRGEAMEFAGHISAAADLAKEFEREPDDSLFNPSSVACRWCPAKINCPAIGAQVGGLVKIGDTLATLDSSTLGRLLDLGPSILADAKEIAQARLLAGQSVAGWKMVTAATKRKLNADAEEILKKKRIRKSVSHTSKLKSPAQLEKAGVDKSLVASISFKPTGGLTLVPMSDKREPVKRSRAVDDFERIE